MGESRRAQVTVIGRDGVPVICIDEFSPRAQELVAQARDAAFIDVGSNYPGVRAPAPAAYSRELLSRLGPLIEHVLGARPEPELDLCAFSMVTAPASALRPSQRIPHYDGPEPRRIAILHYLCGPEQGGTSFYRHRATGFERVTPERSARYLQVVTQQLRHLPPRHDYADAATPGYERIHRVAAAFNRLIIYPGNALHSGDIGAGTVLSENPDSGRLTLNGFGFIRAQ